MVDFAGRIQAERCLQIIDLDCKDSEVVTSFPTYPPLPPSQPHISSLSTHASSLWLLHEHFLHTLVGLKARQILCPRRPRK
ncbi:hypothetical protein A0H81_00703 [Grifola frondosa]|uniref:Uncharacterized protein n=1 Tax=Grifola frondosa TaxID=5627 RepID=A0A1C7MTC4_GRIFR|nr:hypothetical protein A0H81_00703 [Grifola frondosa]